MNLQREYVELYQAIRAYLQPGEIRTLEAAGISLFDLKPRMRADELTGAKLVRVVLEEVLGRGENRALEPLLCFYEKVCAFYRIPDKVSAAGPAPSPSAAPGPAAEARSGPRDKARAS